MQIESSNIPEKFDFTYLYSTCHSNIQVAVSTSTEKKSIPLLCSYKFSLYHRIASLTPFSKSYFGSPPKSRDILRISRRQWSGKLKLDTEGVENGHSLQYPVHRITSSAQRLSQCRQGVIT